MHIEFNHFIQIFQREVWKGTDNNFVECLVFDEKRAVVMTGNMVDSFNPDHINEIVSSRNCYLLSLILNNSVETSSL